MHYPEKQKDSPPLFVKAILVCAGILAGLLISRLFIIPFTVNDSSMKPNFSPGQALLAARFGSLKKGDAVLVKSPLEPDKVLLKRIIATENDTIEINNKNILINKKSAIFPWKTITTDSRTFPMSFSFRDNMPVIKLRKNEYFVIGDNLDYSSDSRTFGKISKEHIKARVFFSF